MVSVLLVGEDDISLSSVTVEAPQSRACLAALKSGNVLWGRESVRSQSRIDNPDTIDLILAASLEQFPKASYSAGCPTPLKPWVLDHAGAAIFVEAEG
jgi:hypothetical protein